MKWFKQSWRKLSIAFKFLTTKVEPIPLESAFVKTYTSPGGIDYQVVLDEKPITTAQAFSYQAHFVDGKIPSTMTLIQANIAGIEVLRPGMKFDKLELRTSTEFGKEFNILFTDIEVESTRFAVAIDDLLTVYTHTLTGVYQKV